MTVELAAVRLIAPWFGTSTGVWTNVIGVVLLALSAGYLLGARLSAGAHPERALGVTLLASAACSAWLPGLARPVARAFLPEGLALDEAAELLQWGSLASALVLFMPAALLLGCTPPLATEALERRTARGAGSSGGRVLAISTIGSIAGTFATTYLAVPVLGLTRTFLISGSIQAIAGACLLWGERRSSRALVGALLAPLVVAWCCSRIQRPPLPSDSRLLESVESRYQSARVVERESDGVRMRLLQVNEGFDSFQSVWQPEKGLFPAGYYYNLFPLPAWWSPRKESWSVLVLGLGGGSVWRVLDGTLPMGEALNSVGVEIDPAIAALGERWLDLDPGGGAGRRVLSGWDAREAVRALDLRFDEIVLDTYANQMEIPAHLSTLEFFRDLRGRLAPGGWLCINIGAFGLDDVVVRALADTVTRAFEQSALVVRVPFSRNCVLFARDGAALPALNGRDPRVGDAAVDALIGALTLPGAHRVWEPTTASVLTDDRNPIEELQRLSIAEGRARWLSMSSSGGER
jgi:spermidine synthase